MGPVKVPKRWFVWETNEILDTKFSLIFNAIKLLFIYYLLLSSTETVALSRFIYILIRYEGSTKSFVEAYEYDRRSKLMKY